MTNRYIPLTQRVVWEHQKTPLSPENLNRIETELYNISEYLANMQSIGSALGKGAIVGDLEAPITENTYLKIAKNPSDSIAEFSESYVSLFEHVHNHSKEGVNISYTGPLVHIDQETCSVNIGNSPSSGLMTFVKGYNNIVEGHHISCFGENNKVGCRGFYWTEVDFTNKLIRISTKQTSLPIATTISLSTFDANFNNPYAVDDVLSLLNFAHFDSACKITNVYNDIIEVDAIPFTKVNSSNLIGVESYSIYAPGKPFPVIANKPVGVYIGKGYSFIEGCLNTITGKSAHSEGESNYSFGNYSHSEGKGTTAGAYASHSEGYGTLVRQQAGHVEGFGTQVDATLTAPLTTPVYGEGIHAAGHAEGESTAVAGHAGHAEGYRTFAKGQAAHAEGNETQALGFFSHAEGKLSKALANQAHAEGYNTEASGDTSHAQGLSTKAVGKGSNSAGEKSEAHGTNSNAEGYNTRAYGGNSHAEGWSSQTGEAGASTGSGAHAEGGATKAYGKFSHTEGEETKARGAFQHVEGRYNIEDVVTYSDGRGKYIHIVGNGTNNSSRSNAYTLDWNGNAVYAGTVKSAGLILSYGSTNYKIYVDSTGALKTQKV